MDGKESVKKEPVRLDLDLQNLEVCLEGNCRRSTLRSDMGKARVLARHLLYLVSGILDRLPEGDKDNEIDSRGNAPIRGLVKSLTKFVSDDWTPNFPA
jgi:hypothetical protein